MTSSSTKAVINLVACQHNLSVAKQAAPDSKCIAIIKANAYGHGMVQIAKALTDADAFGVARIEEAIQLRKSEITTPILLLEGFSSQQELKLVCKYDIECVIHNEEQLQLLEQTQCSPITVVLKIDSGMHRLGVDPDDVVNMVQRLKKCSSVNEDITLMTHLANADDKQDEATVKQIDVFYKSIESLCENETSVANSAGILGWPQSHSSYNRPGIMLYGVSPFVNSTAEIHDLKPVMTLSSKIISIKQVKQGEAIGYGGTYLCDKDMTVGIIAIGYGDGYPRHAKSGTPVLIDGKRCSLLGRVSMDLICIDLSEITNGNDDRDVNVNDEVILWGNGLPIEEIAECSGTIGYELLCGVTRRVDFVYEN